METANLVGKTHVFPDGDRIEVIQIKKSDPSRGGQLVTYLVYQGPGIPRKLVMGIDEFIGTFGHLFKDSA